MPTTPEPSAGQATKVEPVISCRGVVKRFEGRTVLSGIDLDVMPGETMVLMGGSGSGKSTMLRLMIGAIRPDEGSVRILGQDISKLDEEGLNRLRLRFGILFQSGALFNSMTLSENVALPLREHTDLVNAIIDIQVKIKLEMVGLREHATKYPSQISGGMKKRAGLARAIALDPALLYYDEPSAGLDPVTSAQIDQLIVALSRQMGVTSVVVTHEMDSAFTVADRMAMLDQGRILQVERREWFDTLRKTGEPEAAGLSDRERLIRQFLRGDAQGPLAERSSVAAFAKDLLGDAGHPPETPSVISTKG